jgi:hypothetical protein
MMQETTKLGRTLTYVHECVAVVRSPFFCAWVVV